MGEKEEYELIFTDDELFKCYPDLIKPKKQVIRDMMKKLPPEDQKKYLKVWENRWKALDESKEF